MPRTALRRLAAAVAVTTTMSVLTVVATLAPAAAGSGDKPATLVDVQLLALNDFHGALEPPSGSGGRVQTGADPDGTGAATAPVVDAGGVEYLATQLAQLEAAQEQATRSRSPRAT